MIFLYYKKLKKMELLDALRWRYATKKMNGDQIPKEKMGRILESIKLAPSSYGLTPYKVIVIEDQEVKSKLLGACYNQSQVSDSSAVLVFATWTDIIDDDVDLFMDEIAIQRGISVDTLSDYSNLVKGVVKNMNVEQRVSWAQKQAYIGLGFGLVAAAMEGVDSTPMEGFIPEQVDEILGLGDAGLKSSVILALGYRDIENDYLVNQKKVRWPDDYFFIRK